jgi:branched-chain amino acid transport system substrate-binding protein
MRASRLPAFAMVALISSLVQFTSVSAQEAVRIGVLTIRSGPATPVGDDILAGIETATKMFGPVLGRPVELIVEESQWNAQQAVTKATKLVQQNRVVAILGTSTVESLALLPVADRLGVPIVTSNSGSAALTRENCNKWVFRTNAEDLMSAEALRYLISQNAKLAGAKWFTLGHDYPFSRLVAGAVKSVKELNYVGDAFAPMDTTDWSPYIARARAAGATAIMVSVTLGTPMLQFLQQATDFGLTKEAQMVAPIGLPDWLVAKLGGLSTSVISAGSWAAWRYEDTEPTTKEFNEAFFKANGRVAGMQAVQAASAARMLYSAVAKANSTDPDQIVRALETIEVRTPVGPLKFQEGGRQAMVPLFLGPYEAVSPPRYGAEFAQRVEAAFPASKSLTKSAVESGCKLK